MKKAWKTTEFWLALAMTVMGLLVGSGVISSEHVDKGAAAVLAVLSVLGYNVSRAYEKAKRGAPKAGIKTTEFWLSSGAALIGILTSYQAMPDGSSMEQILGAVTAGLAFLGYGAGRGLVKGSTTGDPAKKAMIAKAVAESKTEKTTEDKTEDSKKDG